MSGNRVRTVAMLPLRELFQNIYTGKSPQTYEDNPAPSKGC